MPQWPRDNEDDDENEDGEKESSSGKDGIFSGADIAHYAKDSPSSIFGDDERSSSTSGWNQGLSWGYSERSSIDTDTGDASGNESDQEEVVTGRQEQEETMASKKHERSRKVGKGAAANDEIRRTFIKVLDRPLSIKEEERLRKVLPEAKQRLYRRRLSLGEQRVPEDDQILSKKVSTSDQKWFLADSAEQPFERIELGSDEPFTSDVLKRTVPFIAALEGLQRILDQVKGRETSEFRIRYISSMSPISIGTEGAGDVMRVISEEITPWKRKHKKELATIEEQSLAIELKKKEAEVSEVKRRSAERLAEAKNIKADTKKKMAEVESMDIDNDRKRFELNKDKLALALDIVERINPELAPADKFAFAVSMLPQLSTLIDDPTPVRIQLPE